MVVVSFARCAGLAAQVAALDAEVLEPREAERLVGVFATIRHVACW